MASRLIRGFASILFGKVGTMVGTLLLTPLLVRVLSPGEYGDLAFVLATLSFLMMVVMAGIPAGVRKHLVEDRNRPDWEAHVFGFYGRLMLGIGAIAALTVYLTVQAGVISRILGARFEPYFLIAAGIVAARQVWELVRSVLMAKGEEPVSETLRALNKTGAMAVAILFAYAGYGVAGALVGFLLTPLAATVVAVVRTRSLVSCRSLMASVPSDFPRRMLLTSNGLIYLHGLFSMSMYHVDVLLLNPVAGSEAAGYYKAALTVVQFLWMVPFALETMFVYSTSTHWQEGNMERLQLITERITRYTLLFSLLITLGLAALARPFVELYFGEEYLAAVVPLLILLPGTLAYSVGRPVFGIELANEQPIWTVVVTGSSAALNLALNLLLIPRHGMIGAAVATSIGYGSMLVFHVASARHLGIDPLGDARLPRVLLTGLLAAGPIFLAATIVNPDLLALAITPVVGLAAFVLTAVATGAVDRDETRELASAIQRSIA